MGDAAEVICAFCGSLMELVRKLPTTADSHVLRHFSCTSCGVAEWRIDEPKDGEDAPE
jgi:hypothetical protein